MSVLINRIRYKVLLKVADKLSSRGECFPLKEEDMGYHSLQAGRKMIKCYHFKEVHK